MSGTASGGAGSSRRCADAGRGGPLVAGGRGAAAVPAAGRAAPAAVFAGIKDALRPLPGGPFVLATWARAKIGTDIHARVEKVLYSVPWRHIGKTADVRPSPRPWCSSSSAGQLVKTHPRKVQGKQTRLRRLPAGEDRVPHADPGLVPGRQAAIGRCGQVIGELAGRERAIPAPLGAGRDRAGRRGATRPGWRPPARRPWPPGTRPTGRSRASWPPAPSEALPAAAGDGGAAAFLHGPASFANIIPMPGTITSDAVHPRTRRRPRHDHRHRERQPPAGRPRAGDPRRRGPARAGRRHRPGVCPEPDEIAIQVPEHAGDVPSRAAAVARLAALTGGAPAPDPRPGRTRGWIHARGSSPGTPCTSSPRSSRRQHHDRRLPLPTAARWPPRCAS